MDFEDFLDALKLHCEIAEGDCRKCSLRLWCDTMPKFRTNDLNEQALVILLEDRSDSIRRGIPAVCNHCTSAVNPQFRNILDKFHEETCEPH